MIRKSKNSNTIHLEGNVLVASTCMAAIIFHYKYDSYIKYSQYAISFFKTFSLNIVLEEILSKEKSGKTRIVK